MSLVTTSPKLLTIETGSAPRHTSASKKNSSSVRPRMALCGTNAQRREKSSTALANETICQMANKKSVNTAPSKSSMATPSERAVLDTRRKVKIENTISGRKGFGASTYIPIQTNIQVKRPSPSVAFLKANEVMDSVEGTSQALNPRLARDDGKLPQNIVRAALSSGQLNLSDKGLEKVPDQVWFLNEPFEGSEHKTKGLSLNKIEEEEDFWWTRVDLSKLYLASNRLSSLSSEIRKLSTLMILDLHDNDLHNIPDEIGKLHNLRKLDLSHNKLRDLTEEMFALRSLVSLNVSNNELNCIGGNISSLENLESLDLSNNNLKCLPPSIGFMQKLSYLNVHTNNLASLPDEILLLRNIKTLDCSRNELETMPNSLSELMRLEIACLRHNKLSTMPLLRHSPKLIELYIGNNKLTEITSADVKSFPNTPQIAYKVAIWPRRNLPYKCTYFINHTIKKAQ